MKLEQDFDSNFRYVIVAARRARQLQNGSAPLIASPSSKACKVAQHEIHAGVVHHVRRETPIVKPEFESHDIPRFA